jgi:hypothetical protein
MSRSEWARDVAEVVDAPHAFALLADPLRYLAPFLDGPSHRRKPPSRELPSNDQLRHYIKRLRSSEGAAARRYLLRRGISRDVIRQARIGWNRTCLVFPLRRRGELVNVKLRQPRNGAQMRGWPGLRADDGAFPLYPEPEQEQGWTLLVEGELDALRARSEGLPATSVTLGASAWREEWSTELKGLRVVVCFDVGAEASARRAVAHLQRAGIKATRFDLRRLGMTEKNSDLSDYLNGGGSAGALKRSIRRARKEATR